MNKFVSKQVEAASYTVASKEVERREIEKHIAEFQRVQTKRDSRGAKCRSSRVSTKH